MLAVGAVDVLQGDGTRCGGVSGQLRAEAPRRAHGLAFSAHAPALHTPVCTAMQSAIHLEYFHDQRADRADALRRRTQAGERAA